MTLKKVNLKTAFDSFTDYWNPRIAGALNGQHVKLAKLHGEFVWHKHDLEDELFLVIKGTLTMELRDGNVVIGEQEMLIVPRGTEHRPVATEEVWVLLFEPESTLNTGNVRNERTRDTLNEI